MNHEVRISRDKRTIEILCIARRFFRIKVYDLISGRYIIIEDRRIPLDLDSKVCIPFEKQVRFV